MDRSNQLGANVRNTTKHSLKKARLLQRDCQLLGSNSLQAEAVCDKEDNE